MNTCHIGYLIRLDRKNDATSVAPIHFLVLCKQLPSWDAPSASKPINSSKEYKEIKSDFIFQKLYYDTCVTFMANS